jgi:hypothetical protein
MGSPKQETAFPTQADNIPPRRRFHITLGRSYKLFAIPHTYSARQSQRSQASFLQFNIVHSSYDAPIIFEEMCGSDFRDCMTALGFGGGFGK